MLSITRPTEATVIRYLLAAQDEPYSYRTPFVTQSGSTPEGYNRDRHRVCLGSGPDLFEQAKLAITKWRMFDHGMATLYWPDRPIQKDTNVIVQFRVGPLWSLNPCRVVYTIDEATQFGFAYGTQQGHMESGEELFRVDYVSEDDSVWYEICAVSRPNHIVAHLGYPMARAYQAKFRRASGKAMQSAVSGAAPVVC